MLSKLKFLGSCQSILLCFVFFFFLKKTNVLERECSKLFFIWVKKKKSAKLKALIPAIQLPTYMYIYPNVPTKKSFRHRQREREGGDGQGLSLSETDLPSFSLSHSFIISILSQAIFAFNFHTQSHSFRLALNPWTQVPVLQNQTPRCPRTQYLSQIPRSLHSYKSQTTVQKVFDN